MNRKCAMSYSWYIINGHQFHIKSADRSTQNSGVSVDAAILCQSSAKNKPKIMNIVAYYGML